MRYPAGGRSRLSPFSATAQAARSAGEARRGLGRANPVREGPRASSGGRWGVLRRHRPLVAGRGTPDHCEDAAAKRQLAMRDFATTMVCVDLRWRGTFVAHVGDGAVVVQDAADQQWHVVSWPSHGEYASTTFFVTDEPEPRLSVYRHLGRLSALVAFTDGLERLALDFATQRAHAGFFNGIVGPVAASAATGPGRRALRRAGALPRRSGRECADRRRQDPRGGRPSMSPPQLYVDGKQVRLGQRIGKGGEGEVFAPRRRQRQRDQALLGRRSRVARGQNRGDGPAAAVRQNGSGCLPAGAGPGRARRVSPVS